MAAVVVADVAVVVSAAAGVDVEVVSVEVVSVAADSAVAAGAVAEAGAAVSASSDRAAISARAGAGLFARTNRQQAVDNIEEVRRFASVPFSFQSDHAAMC